MQSFTKLVLSSLFAAALSGSAFASTITGATVYTNTPDPSNAGDLANLSSSLPSANFTIGSKGIDFENQNNVSIATFLNNPTFSNATNGFSSSTPINGTGGQGTELLITGTLTLLAGNNSFVVGHDDGVLLYVNGVLVVNSPGGSLFSTVPFNVYNPVSSSPSQNYTFSLAYSECCNPPADLLFQVNGATVGAAPTPEPSSLALLGTGMVGAYGAFRRRFGRNV